MQSTFQASNTTQHSTAQHSTSQLSQHNEPVPDDDDTAATVATVAAAVATPAAAIAAFWDDVVVFVDVAVDLPPAARGDRDPAAAAVVVDVVDDTA